MIFEEVKPNLKPSLSSLLLLNIISDSTEEKERKFSTYFKLNSRFTQYELSEIGKVLYYSAKYYADDHSLEKIYFNKVYNMNIDCSISTRKEPNFKYTISYLYYTCIIGVNIENSEVRYISFDMYKECTSLVRIPNIGTELDIDNIKSLVPSDIKDNIIDYNVILRTYFLDLMSFFDANYDIKTNLKNDFEKKQGINFF